MQNEGIQQKKTLPSSFADKLGLTGSVLCLVHCMALPVLAAFSTGLAGGVPHIHGQLFPGDDYFFILLAVVAVLFSLKYVRSKKIAISLVVCILLFSVPMGLSHHIHFLHQFEWLSHIGAIGLAVTHWLNLRSLRTQKNACVR